MKVLVAWDDRMEAELISTYLSSSNNAAVVCPAADDVLARARQDKWDVVLMALTFPTSADDAFALFGQVRKTMPKVPIVVACRQTELFRLPHFLTHGLRYYFVRDDRGDFVFLVLSHLELAVTAARAEESRKVLERLTDYLRE